MWQFGTLSVLPVLRLRPIEHGQTHNYSLFQLLLPQLAALGRLMPSANQRNCTQLSNHKFHPIVDLSLQQTFSTPNRTTFNQRDLFLILFPPPTWNRLHCTDNFATKKTYFGLDV
jgi:hypothetical protein